MSNQRVTKLKKYDTLAEWIKRHGKTPYYRDAVIKMPDGTYKIRAYVEADIDSVHVRTKHIQLGY